MTALADEDVGRAANCMDCQSRLVRVIFDWPLLQASKQRAFPGILNSVSLGLIAPDLQLV